jgi:hypothetical protein
MATMRELAVALIGALCIGNAGCRVFCQGARTLVLEPIQYCNKLDRWRTHSRHYRLATFVWEEFACQHSGLSADFERGFKDGFTDYLDFGGTGEPPPLPPRMYWKDDYQSLAGHVAIEDWFAGFRQGAAEAQASGWRDFATVPSSVGAPAEIALAFPNRNRDDQVESNSTPGSNTIPIEELPPVSGR